MKHVIFLFVIVGLLAVSCKDDENCTCQGVKYKVKATAKWTSATHPTDYPSNPHFSPITGMVHKPGTTIFALNETATDGIEVMAETGGTDQLKSEIQTLVSEKSAGMFIKDSGFSNGTASVEFEVKVNKEYNTVTLVSMIAPSPDWFVAFENIKLYNGENFLETFSMEGVLYDAGTDNGETFTSANSDTQPAEPISLITQAPLGNGNTVDPPVMSIVFTKID